MVNKKMAVVLMCVAVVAALQLSTADKSADVKEKVKSFFAELGKVEAKFKSCCQTCEKECMEKGHDYNSCHSKCVSYCGKKGVADMEANCKLSTDDLGSIEAEFKSYCKTCEKECMAKGNDYSSCHSKCDSYCGKKKVADIPHS